MVWIQMEVLYQKEDRFATITISRERAYNALNRAIIKRLGEIFFELESDDAVGAVIITGAGQKAFVAGADIKEIVEAGQERPALIKKGQEVFTMIRNSSKVVIAAINGFALGGGCELALACDVRFAAENAKFALPEAKLGLMPGYGGTQLLPRLVGTGRAKYMMFSGDMISAEEAYQFGLVDRISKAETLMDEVRQFAEKVVANGPLAIRGIKRALRGGIELALEDALDLEFTEYTRVALSSDAEEGMRAFMEKKSPSFRGT
jgi:enoyl-CoA hydratase